MHQKRYATEFLHPEAGWTRAHYNDRLEMAKLYAKTARDNWHQPTHVLDLAGWGTPIVASYRHP